MAVVHEADAPHVDHPEVGGGLLEGADVEHLVHLTGYSIIAPDIVLQYTSPSSSSPCS